jgi:hypothetical protein
MKQQQLNLVSIGLKKIDAQHFETHKGDYAIQVSISSNYYFVSIRDQYGVVFEDIVETIEEVCSLVESCDTIMDIYYDALNEEDDYNEQ